MSGVGVTLAHEQARGARSVEDMPNWQASGCRGRGTCWEMVGEAYAGLVILKW